MNTYKRHRIPSDINRSDSCRNDLQVILAASVGSSGASRRDGVTAADPA